MGQVSQHSYDTLLPLKAAALVASSAAGSLIVNVAPGTLGHKAVVPKIEADLVIDVTALEIASNDEIYDIILQGSPDAAFGTAGNIQELAAISLSAKEVKRSDSDKDDDVGRFILPVRNEFGGTTYQYLRIYTVVAGTIATGINYSAYLGMRSVL